VSIVNVNVLNKITPTGIDILNLVKKKHKCAIKDRKETWTDFSIKNQ